MNAERTTMVALLERYECAINEANCAAIGALFLPNGVSIAELRAPANRRIATRNAYERIVGAVKLRIDRAIKGMPSMCAPFTLFRTNAVCKVKAVATQESDDPFRKELFGLKTTRRICEQWLANASTTLTSVVSHNSDVRGHGL